jgi:UDP-glucose 4-epimerase
MQNAVRGVLGIAPFFLNYTQVDTPDGSPIRDYVNVVDLNEAHLKAVQYIETGGASDVFNLGTGNGNSVLEIIKTVENITGKTIEKQQGERRSSDVSKAVASNEKITRVLGWHPTRSLEQSVNSLVTWYTQHPHGWDS